MPRVPATSLTARYGADPVPWIAATWSDALKSGVADRRLARALTALDSIVGGLADDERAYTVRYAGDPVGAATDLKGRVVHVGAAPLADGTLTDGQIAAIMTGLAFHEVAHIRHTRKVLAAYDRFAPAERGIAQRVGNVAEDVRGERLTCAEFPGLADTLPVTLAWVAGRTMPANVRAAKIADRFNLMLAAVRYAEYCDWSGMTAERDAWQAWGERCAQAHTVDQHAAVVREGIDMLASAPLTDPGTEPGDEPGEGEPGEGEGKGEPGEGKPGADSAEGEGEGEGGEPGAEGEGTPGDEPTQGMGNPDGKGGAASDSDLGPAVVALFPECASEAAKDARTDANAQDAAENIAASRRDREGTRTYGGSTVKRGYQLRRGTATRGTDAGDGTVGFLAPNAGRGIMATYAGRAIRQPLIRPMVSRALAGAITGAKRGDPAPEAGQRSGTLDRTRLARVRSGDCRVFTSRVTPGPQRIRCIVLLDASGSMQGALDNTPAARMDAMRGGAVRPTRAEAAAQIGVDMAGAIAQLPNVQGAVYAHNLNLGGATVHALWQKGEPVKYAADYANLHLDGNLDDLAIRYCTDDLTEAAKPGESLVLIVVSDGAPPDQRAVQAAVADARKRGVAVVSVAIAVEAEVGQRFMYGDADVVLFQPEPVVLARKIAVAIGKRV